MKIKLSDFSKHLREKLETAVDHVTSKTYLKEIGNDIAKDIKQRTKLGYGVDKSLGKQAKFKPLADSTKKGRKYKKRNGKLSSDTSPAKSNLTETASMVNDLEVDIKNNKITLDLKAKFSQDKAKWNSDKGRTFMNISNSQYKTLIKKLQKDISKILK